MCKLNSRVSVNIGLSALMLILSPVTLASNSTLVNIPLTLVNAQRTCTLGFNGNASTLNYSLGTLDTGTFKHKPFSIDISCTGNIPVKTALVAKNLNGVLLAGNEQLEMTVNGNVGSGGPLLWLEDNGSRIKLTGAESDSFCKKKDLLNSTCNLTPVTDVKNSDPKGNVSATIRFEVVYPV